MAAPVKTTIQLPTEAGNNGKKIQVQSEVIGADTVHAHFYIPRSRRKLLGVYGFAHALLSVQAAAHTNNTQGFWWLQVPIGSTIRARLRRLGFQYSMVTELDHLTAPRIVATRFTFTGTASGATVTPAKRLVSSPTGDSSDAAAVAQMRTAITGMTCTYETGHWFSALTPAFLVTTSGIVFAESRQSLEPNDEEEFFDIGAGEGIVLWQLDAGTASDGRRFLSWGRWDEYDNA